MLLGKAVGKFILRVRAFSFLLQATQISLSIY